MKRRTVLLWLITAMMLLLCFGFIVACSQEGDPLLLSASNVTLEAYDDYQISVEEETDSPVVWSSSDESIATVSDDGLVSCLGETGDITITAQMGNKIGECAVHIVDSGLTPRLNGDAQTAYVNGVSAPDVYVQYNDNRYTEFTISSITVADTALAIVEDGKLKGVSAGETSFTMEAVWKGQTVRTRTPIALTVLPEYVITTDAQTYSIYDVNENSSVKRRTAEIDAELYVRGVLQEDATFSIQGEGLGTEYTAEGLTVTAGTITEQVTRTLTISAQVDGQTVETTVTLEVCPAFEQRDTDEFVVFGSAVFEQIDSGEKVGERQNVYRYFTGENCANSNNDWIVWGNQLQLQPLASSGTTSAYQNIVLEDGVALVSFDVFYAGQTVGGAKQYRGINVNLQYGPYSGDSTYYVDHVKNVPERIIVDDGKITNTLVPEKWVTFYVDLRVMEKYSQIDTYIFSIRANDTTYVDNVRFWYDDSAIAGLDRSQIDLNERVVEQDSQNASRYRASENEFMPFSIAFTDFSRKEESGEAYYHYAAKQPAGTGYQNWIRSQRKIFPWHVYYERAIGEGFQYFSFDYRYVAGTPVMYVYDDTMSDSTAQTVTLLGMVNNPNVFIFQNGKRITSIPEGEWVSIVVPINSSGSSTKDSIYLSCDDPITSAAVTQFDVRTCNYWKDQSWLYDAGYGSESLLEVQVDSYDYAIDGERTALSSLIRVTWRGHSISDYTISDFSVINGSDVLSYDEETHELIISEQEEDLKVREADATFFVSYTENDHKESIQCTLHVVAYPKDAILIEEDEYSVYCGTNADFVSERSITIEVASLIVNGVPASSVNEVKARVISGEEYVSVSGLTVTGISIGEAVVQLYYEKTDGSEVTVDVTVNVHDGAIDAAWVKRDSGSASVITLEPAEDADGRYGVLWYTVSSDVWNNYIVLEASAHTSAGGTVSTAQAMQNMYNNNYNYVAFDFKVPAGTQFYLYAPAGTAYANIRIVAGSALGSTDLPASVYDANGMILQEGEIIQANAWYTLVLKYDRAADSTQWACVRIMHTAGEGIYLDNTIYAYDETAALPDAAKELSVNIPETVYESWDGKATISVTATIGGEEVPATISYTVLSGGASCDSNGVVTLPENGTDEVSVQVSVTYEGQVKTGTVTVQRGLLEEQAAGEAWGLKDNTQNSYTASPDSEFGSYILSTDVWNDYLVLKECDGRMCSDREWSTTQEAIEHMRESNYNIIVFKIKVTDGVARIYVPVNEGNQNYVSLGSGKYTVNPEVQNTGTTTVSESAEGYLTVYDAEGNKLQNGDDVSNDIEYTVVIKYNHSYSIGGRGEVCIKGSACKAELSGVAFWAA